MIYFTLPRKSSHEILADFISPSHIPPSESLTALSPLAVRRHHTMDVFLPPLISSPIVFYLKSVVTPTVRLIYMQFPTAFGRDLWINGQSPTRQHSKFARSGLRNICPAPSSVPTAPGDHRHLQSSTSKRAASAVSSRASAHPRSPPSAPSRSASQLLPPPIPPHILVRPTNDAPTPPWQ